MARLLPRGLLVEKPLARTALPVQTALKLSLAPLRVLQTHAIDVRGEVENVPHREARLREVEKVGQQADFGRAALRLPEIGAPFRVPRVWAAAEPAHAGVDNRLDTREGHDLPREQNRRRRLGPAELQVGHERFEHYLNRLLGWNLNKRQRGIGHG